MITEHFIRILISLLFFLEILGAHGQQPIYAQCGGIGWSGGTNCVSGTSCSSLNPYYFQCLTGTTSAATTTQKTTTTASARITTTSSSASTATAGGSLNLPLSTSGRDMLSSKGQKVVYVGANWPGHMYTMIPEGLEYNSIANIVSLIKGMGLNSVRLTFAIEMVDNILDNGGDVSLETAFTRAMGQTDGQRILGNLLSHNPQFSRTTTRLQVFDAVSVEFAKQGIYMHLDNQVSKASWCCGSGDGNAWFGDTYFNVDKWVRAWSYLASHGAKNWPSFASVGLRNELRQADNGRGESYDWYTWYNRMTAAANAVYSSNPNVLIFFSGLDYDGWVSPLVWGSALTGTGSNSGKTAYFVPSNFAFSKKIVLEIHKYDFTPFYGQCSDFTTSLLNAGFNALSSTAGVKYNFPVVMTEWGFSQDGVYYKSTNYNQCLIAFFTQWKAGWMYWDLTGSWYCFAWSLGGSLVLDQDDGWGLLNHQWNGYRSPATLAGSLTPMIKASLG